MSMLGKIPWNKGKSPPLEVREKISKSLKGRVSPMKGRKSPHSIEHRRKIGLARSGEKSNFWKGGITKSNLLIRMSMESKLWRQSVFERDNYTCIWCGDNKGGNLEADHIKPFALFPELRFVIDNGRTLCKDCHKKTDTWGRKTNPITWN